MKGKRHRARRREHLKRGGYSTDKPISMSKFPPKGPAPGAPRRPKDSKKD